MHHTTLLGLYAEQCLAAYAAEHGLPRPLSPEQLRDANIAVLHHMALCETRNLLQAVPPEDRPVDAKYLARIRGLRPLVEQFYDIRNATSVNPGAELTMDDLDAVIGEFQSIVRELYGRQFSETDDE